MKGFKPYNVSSEDTSVNVLGTHGSACSSTKITGVLTPTAIPSNCPADSAYDCPNSPDEWGKLVPESVKSSCSGLLPVAPLTGILSVSALTATETEYDSFVHQNVRTLSFKPTFMLYDQLPLTPSLKVSNPKPS